LRQALEFRARRTVGEAPVALRKLRPGIRYRADEFALKDRFDNPYSGKLYRSGGVDEATEILTMGVQFLMEEPVRFYTVDRAYFEFVLRAIWGALPYGSARTCCPRIPTCVRLCRRCAAALGARTSPLR